MCNEEQGFILMLRTEHKLKIDVDSRIFQAVVFKRCSFRLETGWAGMGGRTDPLCGEAEQWGGSRVSFPSLMGPQQKACFLPKIAFNLHC